METLRVDQTETQSKSSIWAGRILTGLTALFLLFDAVMKIIKEQHSIDGSARLGWPVDLVPAIGIILLLSTILYIVPRTAFIGAILITGYLGGAIAIMVRSGTPFYFPLVFGVLVWAGLYFRNEKLRALIRG